MNALAAALLVLLAFSAGLNLGLHGGMLQLLHLQVPGLGSQRANEPTRLAEFDSTSGDGPRHEAASTVGASSLSISSPSRVASQSPTVAPTTTVAPFAPKPASGAVVAQSKINSLVQSLAAQGPALDMSAPNPYSSCPVVLLTANRAQLLEQTLQSLLRVRGVSKRNVLVVQDGSQQDVSDVIRRFDLEVIRNPRRLRNPNGAALIAQHYHFALSAAFDHYRDAQCVIVVEDDLLFAPDFYEYLTTASRVLLSDPSTWIVSAWNDNGFTEHVRDPYRLLRTDYFPGLGWLLTRKLYIEELKDHWPGEHWDHWMRSPEVHRHREIVYPQVPRTFHNGVKGTFMTQSMHNQYFRDIAVQRDPRVTWGAGTEALPHELTVAQRPLYRRRVETLVGQCRHVAAVSELFARSGEVLCVWIDVDPNPDPPQPFGPPSRLFHLWHEHRRGNLRGLHEFYFLDNYVLLLNTHHALGTDSYRALKPAAAQTVVVTAEDVTALAEHRRAKVKDLVVRAEREDRSCDEVCAARQEHCDEGALGLLNSCEALKTWFGGCSLGCNASVGSDQPAGVRRGDGYECLYNMDPAHAPMTCAGKHADTLRLCVCVPAS